MDTMFGCCPFRRSGLILKHEVIFGQRIYWYELKTPKKQSKKVQVQKYQNAVRVGLLKTNDELNLLQIQVKQERCIGHQKCWFEQNLKKKTKILSGRHEKQRTSQG